MRASRLCAGRRGTPWVACTLAVVIALARGEPSFDEDFTKEQENVQAQAIRAATAAAAREQQRHPMLRDLGKVQSKDLPDVNDRAAPQPHATENTKERANWVQHGLGKHAYPVWRMKHASYNDGIRHGKLPPYHVHSKFWQDKMAPNPTSTRCNDNSTFSLYSKYQGTPVKPGPGAPSSAKSANECCSLCSHNHDCDYWSWRHDSGACLLQRGLPVNWVPDAHFTSGFYDPPPPTPAPTKFDWCATQPSRKNTDYHGADLIKGGLMSASASDCCERCQKRRECFFWTYGTDKKKCWLKKTDTGFEHQANRISGEKNKVSSMFAKEVLRRTPAPTKAEKKADWCTANPGHHNVDYHGSDIIKGGLKAKSANECCNHCQKNRECHFWTYGSDRHKCWIKRTDAGEETQRHRISGTKNVVDSAMAKAVQEHITIAPAMARKGRRWGRGRCRHGHMRSSCKIRKGRKGRKGKRSRKGRRHKKGRKGRRHKKGRKGRKGRRHKKGRRRKAKRAAAKAKRAAAKAKKRAAARAKKAKARAKKAKKRAAAKQKAAAAKVQKAKAAEKKAKTPAAKKAAAAKVTNAKAVEKKAASVTKKAKAAEKKAAAKSKKAKAANNKAAAKAAEKKLGASVKRLINMKKHLRKAKKNFKVRTAPRTKPPAQQHLEKDIDRISGKLDNLRKLVAPIIKDQEHIMNKVKDSAQPDISFVTSAVKNALRKSKRKSHHNKPAAAPTGAPVTAPPTNKPSARPTVAPTFDPTAPPTAAPSLAPTEPPTTLSPTTTRVPSAAPTMAPTEMPSAVPSATPSEAPTLSKRQRRKAEKAAKKAAMKAVKKVVKAVKGSVHKAKKAKKMPHGKFIKFSTKAARAAEPVAMASARVAEEKTLRKFGVMDTEVRKMVNEVKLNLFCSVHPHDPRVDYHGSDLIKGGLYATSAAQCCKKCSKVKGCKYWTYGTNRHRCWVKSTMAGYERQRNRIAGTVDPSKVAAERKPAISPPGSPLQGGKPASKKAAIAVGNKVTKHIVMSTKKAAAAAGKDAGLPAAAYKDFVAALSEEAKNVAKHAVPDAERAEAERFGVSPAQARRAYPS